MEYSEIFPKVVSHAKEYGYVFQSSEIYDGLGAVYDYGQLGGRAQKQPQKRLVEGHGPDAREHRRTGFCHPHAPYHLEGLRPRRCLQRPPD